MNCN